MRNFICNVELIQIWFDLGLVMDEITKLLLKKGKLNLLIFSRLVLVNCRYCY